MPLESVTDPSREFKPLRLWSLWKQWRFLWAMFIRDDSRIYQRYHTKRLGRAIRTWGRDEQILAIEEGRRQLDGQFAKLQHIAYRASVFLPVAIAISVFFVTETDRLDELERPWLVIASVLVVLGSGLAAWGAMLMGAIVVARPRRAQTDAVLLTEEFDPRAYLARDYAEAVPVGEDAVVALQALLTAALAWIMLGAIVGAFGTAIIRSMG